MQCPFAEIMASCKQLLMYLHVAAPSKAWLCHVA